MGTSTDAMLFYGVFFGSGEENDLPWGEDGDSDEWVAGALGWRQGEDSPSAYAYLKKANIEVGIHCSGDCPMYYLALATRHLTASRGYTEEVRGDFLEVSHDDRVKFITLLQELSIAALPKWYLCSYWG